MILTKVGHEKRLWAWISLEVVTAAELQDFRDRCNSLSIQQWILRLTIQAASLVFRINCSVNLEAACLLCWRMVLLMNICHGDCGSASRAAVQ